jgi:hypothetical protein
MEHSEKGKPGSKHQIVAIYCTPSPLKTGSKGPEKIMLERTKSSYTLLTSLNMGKVPRVHMSPLFCLPAGKLTYRDLAGSYVSI